MEIEKEAKEEWESEDEKDGEKEEEDGKADTSKSKGAIAPESTLKSN